MSGKGNAGRRRWSASEPGKFHERVGYEKKSDDSVLSEWRGILIPRVGYKKSCWKPGGSVSGKVGGAS
jgi:hypothetical protein